MWLVKYYPLIHEIALSLSLGVVGVVLSFFLVALITRFWLDRRDRRHQKKYSQWMQRFENQDLHKSSKKEDSLTLDSLYYREQYLAFRAWLEVYENADEVERSRLQQRAKDLGLPETAFDHLKGSVQEQVTACRILGYTRTDDFRESLEELLKIENPYLNLAVLEALCRIDIDRNLERLIDYIISHPKINYYFATRPLENLSQIQYSKRLVGILKTKELDGVEWILRLLEYADCEDHRVFALKLLRNSENAEILAKILRQVRDCDFSDVKERVRDLLQHNAWFVQLQASITLGEIGDSRDIDALKNLLGHPEWWVRYRSAQAIEKLAGSDSSVLRNLLEAVDDRYAQDILKQIQSE